MDVRRTFAVALVILSLGWSTAHAEQYTIPLFPAPGTSGDPQGVLRIVNDTGEAATVRVVAIADDGSRSGPATIALGATAAAEFDATELRSANPAKGLSGGLGRLSGDVRLSISSDVPVVPMAFVRAPDGTLSAMHDTVRPTAGAAGEAYRYEISVFNPSTVVTQASRLRLINPGDTPATVTIAGRDDSGAVARGGDVTLTLAAGGARTLTAQQLEVGGTGLTGRLGAATGGWRLTVSSDRPVQAVNIVASSTGRWNNLSTTAVRGAASADLANFNDRFVGESAVLEVEGGRSALMFMENGRFAETVQVGGTVATSEGGYDYAGLGPDAGRLTLEYDGGGRCRVNVYFTSRTRGWFASHCAGDVDPDETRSGGNWFVEGEQDGGGADPVETTYGVNEALPGLPTSGSFIPARLSGGSVSVSGGSTTIDLNNGGQIELNDGTRYACASAGGCEIVDGTVTRGSVTGRALGPGGGIDRSPGFPAQGRPGDRTYTVGEAIDALTLPEATGGNPPLTYSLSPDVPGLRFAAAARRLTGTPTEVGSYAMSYTVTDADGDSYTIYFTIAVGVGAATGTVGIADLPGFRSTGIAYASGRFYFLSWRDAKVYAYTGTGQRDRDNDFDLVQDVGPLDRLAYANGRFYVFHAQGAGGKLFAYTAAGQRDAANDFVLQYDEWPRGIASADGLTYVVNVRAGKVYAYTASGTRELPADFDLDDDHLSPSGIVYAASRFYVLDTRAAKVFAYTGSGARDAGADFELECDNRAGRGITYADGSFYVLDATDWRVYTYSGTGELTSSSVCFHGNLNPGTQIYRLGTAISELALPAARPAPGGGPLTYSLSPAIPGLSFNAATRRLSGTPTAGGRYRMTYTVSDVGGESDSLTFSIVVETPDPDLVVESVSVSDSSLDAGQRFTLRATVRNDGTTSSSPTTLRYYRSSTTTISDSDTQVGTVRMGGLFASSASTQSISLTAPSSAGTYYYGACVDMVPDERDRGNNCSSGVRVTVSGSGGGGGSTDACRAGLVVNPGESCTYNGADFSVSNSGRGTILAGGILLASSSQIDARGSTFNGVRWNFYATRNSGSNSWTIQVAESGGSGGSGGSTAGCRATLVVNPGESCTYNGADFSVSNSGRGTILAGGILLTSSSQIDARGSTFNGVRWNFYATRNSGSNSWTIQVAD